MTQPEPAIELVNNEGLAEVGEITTRVMREAIQEPDFTHARQAGATDAYTICLAWVAERLRMAGEYDDTRELQNMVTWLGDKIREVNSPKTNGSDGAS